MLEASNRLGNLRHTQWVPKIVAQTDQALGKGYKRNAWHLQLLAVHPDHQGKGVGGSLVKAGEARVSSFRKLHRILTHLIPTRHLQTGRMFVWKHSQNPGYERQTGGCLTITHAISTRSGCTRIGVSC